MKNIFTISKYHLLNNMRNKVFHLSLGFMIILSVFSILIGEMAVYSQGRFILNFCLLSIQSVSMLNALISGTLFFKKDTEKNGLIQLVVSKPVSRNQFISSYIISGSITLAINISIMTIFSVAIFYFQHVSFNINFFYANLLFWFLSTIVLAVSIFFSTITGTFVSFFSSIIYIFCGYFVKDIYLLSDKGTGFAQALGSTLKYTIPDLMIFDIKNQVVYQSHININYIFQAFIYFLLWATVLTALSCITINKKDL